MQTVSSMQRQNKDLSKAARLTLEVAESLFASKGFNAVSMNAIAQQAGVSKANIFHHFKSKQGLFMAVLKTACRRSASALHDRETTTTVTPFVRMHDFFISHLQGLLAQPESTRLIQWELMENSEQRGKQLAEEVFADTFASVVELVAEAQAQGFVKADIDVSLLAYLLVGANVFFFETRAVLKHMPGVGFADSAEHYSAAVFQLLAEGFEKSTSI